MEPLDRQELNDQELNSLLAEWTTPPIPATLRGHVFARSRRPWWLRIWSSSIRIPVPVAACLALAISFGVWRSLSASSVSPSPPPGRVVTRTERVDVPVIRERIVTKVVYRDRVRVQTSRLQPVAELRPKIIRNRHAEN